MISILLPVYNATPYLEECLDSILEQSESNWELWAVDDQSTDTSSKILAKYASRDKRIHVLQNLNKGIIPALRMALANSCGQLITRMDADDIMPRKKLSILKSLCSQDCIATGKVEYFSSEGKLGDGYLRYSNWLNTLVDTRSHWQEIYKECVIPSPAWMVQRDTLLRIGAFDSDHYPEDYDLVFRMYAADLLVRSSSEIVHRWRDHSRRASRNDPNYTDNRFLSLKTQHFVAIDHDDKRPLALWGAGKKGKAIASKLLELDILFTWHTDTMQKQGVDIYGQILSSSDSIPLDARCIIAIASPDDTPAIDSLCRERMDIKDFRFC